MEGLDVLEHGSPGYAGDSLAGFSLEDLVPAGASTSTKSEV